MQDELIAIKKAKLQLVAVSYDSPETLKEFAKQARITFPLLSDQKSKAIAAYGVLNQKAKGGQGGIPHPGTFLIGQDGKIYDKLFYSVVKRHPAKELIKAAEKLPKPKRKAA